MINNASCVTLRESIHEKSLCTIKQRFHNSIVVGDSIVESLLDYRLLDRHHAIARRNRSISHVFGDLLLTVSYEPDSVFMMYGKNDIIQFENNISSFIYSYKDAILFLRNELPEIEIFINSILPSRMDVMSIYGGLQTLEKFNLALQHMCEEMHINFIDNSEVEKWTDDIFEYDGYYPSYSFYVKWLKHMADFANL